MAYHFISRTTPFFPWPSTFRQRIRKDMLLLYMSRVQRAVVLELRTITYVLRFSDPKKSCLKYTDFSTTYQLSYQERLIISKTIKKYSGTQRILFIGEKSRWWTLLSWYSSSRIRCIQITHIAFRTCFGNLWTRREKYTIEEGRQNRKGKDRRDSTHGKHFSLRTVMSSLLPDPDQTACLVG